MDYEVVFLGSLTLIYLLALLYWVFLKDLINGLNLSSFGQFKKFYTRVSSFGDLNLVGNNGKNSGIRSVNGVLATGCLLIFFLILGFAYWLLSSDLQPNSLDQGFSIPGPNDAKGQCNLFDGKWVPDDSYPLYNASDCPFAEVGFNCLANGRRDSDYMKWRWKPKDCDLPRFDVQALLNYLRGKRVVFVGDSLTRTQWESFICMLMSGVEDKRFVYEVNQNPISKKIRFLNVRFDSYDFTVEFYRSVFLSWLTTPPKRAPKRVKWTIRLDKMDNANEEWIDSDVLIFNTGHWWTKTKLFETGTYFQVGKSLKLGMPVSKALTRALETWASWVESRINHNRTHVFFRTFEASHWSGRNRNACKVTRRPMLTTKGRDKSPISDMILRVIKSMSAPVTPLHVTPMGAYRSDAHVGRWSDNPSVPDCSHWCLPGLPDMWNEIVFTYLLHKDQITQQQTAK
ncbi:protein trichome berefringence-like 7 [Chenopodium quinoa]|uniref:protein trichome berefringence-like 7 n=1 Tax=Chenopodium quinoa TaxID=63459 RepID=UPI000B7855EE|nr:protein trichome berefringence-like 7 [Chenopodium quinoa]